MDHERNTERFCRPTHRDAHISAERDHHIRLDLGEPLFRALRALLNGAQRFGQRERMSAIEPARLESFEWQPRFFHQTRLDALRRARIEDLMALLFQRLSKCERRIDMTGGTTT